MSVLISEQGGFPGSFSLSDKLHTARQEENADNPDLPIPSQLFLAHYGFMQGGFMA